MNLHLKNNLWYFTFSRLDRFREEVRHGVFTRVGGVSRPPFHTLNTSISVGDDLESVRRNRNMVSVCLDFRDMVFLKQVHGAHVVVVDPQTPHGPPPAADGMITRHPGVFLAIQGADCQAVLLYDPVRRVAAAVHSGWRGTVQNIIGSTIGTMTAAFGCRPGDIIAGIGPSLGPCCGEFVNYQREIPEAFWKYKNHRHHFDFWAVSRDQLMDAGLPPEQIECAGMCTRCNDHLFFSYRKTPQTGRFVAGIGLTPQLGWQPFSG